MTKEQLALLDIIERDYGPQGRKAVSSLMHLGTLDGYITKKHLICLDMWKGLVSTTRSCLQLQYDIAEDHHVGRGTVLRVVQKTN